MGAPLRRDRESSAASDAVAFGDWWRGGVVDCETGVGVSGVVVEDVPRRHLDHPRMQLWRRRRRRLS